MVIPATFESGLLLLILTLLCAGLWTSTFKAAKSFRYELYYIDFSLGAVICGALAAFTLGSLHSNELTFSDNLLITGYRQMAYAMAAGVAFNLGNLLLVGAISVGGLTLCVPTAWGVALVIIAILNFVADQHINVVLTFGGAVLLLLSIAVFAMAYFRNAGVLAEAAKKAFLADPRVKSSRRTGSAAGAGAALLLSIVAGIIFGFSPNLLDFARMGDNGISPYGLVLLFTCGIIGSTIVYMPFMLAFPLAGTSTNIAEYLRAKRVNHIRGMVGGILFTAGVLAYYLVTGTLTARLIGPTIITALSQGAPLLAILLGVFFWKEFKAVASSTMPLVWGGFFLCAVGVALIAFAPVYQSAK